MVSFRIVPRTLTHREQGVIVGKPKMASLLSNRLALCLLASSALTGCSAILHPVRKITHVTGQLTFDVTLDPEANQNSPLAVDVVTISDKKLLSDLSKMTAQAWFQKKTSTVRMYPNDLHVYSWEWVPGQQVSSMKIPQTALADGILLFANYSSSGEHSAVLPRSGTTRIDFGPKDFKILPSGTR